MNYNQQKNVRNDAEFEPFLKNYEEIKSFEELQSLPGAYVRYKTQHFMPNGTSETLYRFGGLCTYVDKSYEFFTLKNLYAEKKGAYSNRWSVQLKYQMKKEPGSNEALYIPIVPSWQIRQGEKLRELSKLIKASRQGVVVITVYANNPKSATRQDEVRRLQELVERLQSEANQSKASNSAQRPNARANVDKTNKTNNTNVSPYQSFRTDNSPIRSKAIGNMF